MVKLIFFDLPVFHFVKSVRLKIDPINIRLTFFLLRSKYTFIFNFTVKHFVFPNDFFLLKQLGVYYRVSKLFFEVKCPGPFSFKSRRFVMVR
jgi:hypothetical protein